MPLVSMNTAAAEFRKEPIGMIWTRFHFSLIGRFVQLILYLSKTQNLPISFHAEPLAALDASIQTPSRSSMGNHTPALLFCKRLKPYICFLLLQAATNSGVQPILGQAISWATCKQDTKLGLLRQRCCSRFIFAEHINKMSSRRVWSQQEDECISQLVQLHGVKNWAQVATDLFKRSGPPKRSGKQCRERWHNHLNPHIERKTWTRAEEERMFQLQQQHGNKWTVIAAALPGRTDNAIKNYFYSRVRRSLRRMGKFVGSKNSTETMKQLKPSTLSYIFAPQTPLLPHLPPEQLTLLGYVRAHCASVRNQIIKFTHYKPRRNDKASEAERTDFSQVIEKLIYINDTYEKIKAIEKRMRSEELMFQRATRKLILSDDSYSEQDHPHSDDSVQDFPQHSLQLQSDPHNDQPELGFHQLHCQEHSAAIVSQFPSEQFLEKQGKSLSLEKQHKRRFLEKQHKREVLEKQGKREVLAKQGKRQFLEKQGKREVLAKQGKKAEGSKHGQAQFQLISNKIKHIQNQIQMQQIQNTNLQSIKASPFMAAVSLQAQFSPLFHALSPANHPENQLPAFLIQLKQEECIPAENGNRYGLSGQSPGCFSNTPTNNPFSFFSSPSWHHDHYSRMVQGFRGLQQVSTDELQIVAIELKRHVEQNTGRERQEQSQTKQASVIARGPEKCPSGHQQLP